MSKKVIIFDFDGTLADSLNLFIEISNYFADKYSFKKILPEQIEYIRSLSSNEIRKFLGVPIYKMPFLAPRFRKRTYSFVNKLKLFDGIEDLIKSLYEKGYVLGIISMNSAENVNKFLNEKKLLSFIDFVYSANVFQGKEKIIKKWLNINKCKYSKVIYVGDEIRDIISCKHSGVPIIAVSWGYNTKYSLEKHNPNYLTDSVEDLNNLIATFFKE